MANANSALNIAVVEDNPADAAILRKYLSDFFAGTDETCNIELFGDSEVFYRAFSPKYNIVFLDIEMPNVSGMEIARKLRAADKDVVIVFVTAMAQYAVEGYEVNAFDYIVKPVSYSAFTVKLKRILESFRVTADKEIWIKAVGLCQKRIRVSELKYVEVVKHDCIYHTLHGDYRVTTSMTKVAEELKGLPFALCNQCYLVHLKYVTETKADFAVVGGDLLPVSRAKKKEFMHSLNNYLARTVGE